MERHEIEIKVRLTERDAALLVSIARREDMPTAVLARTIIRRQLAKLMRAGVSVPDPR